MKLNLASCPNCKDHHYNIDVQILKNPIWIHEIEYTHYIVCENVSQPIIVYVTVGITNKVVKP